VRVGVVTTSSCDRLVSTGPSSRVEPTCSSPEASPVSWVFPAALRAAAIIVVGMVPLWPLAIIALDALVYPPRSGAGAPEGRGPGPGPPLLILLVALLAIP